MSTKDALPLTDRQTVLLSYICQSIKKKPEIDMEKFQKLAGYGNVASATRGFHKIMKAVMTGKGDADEEGEEAASPAKGKKRKGKSDDDAGDEEEEGATPAKKQKATPVKKGRGKKAVPAGGDEDGDAGDEGTEIKREAED